MVDFSKKYIKGSSDPSQFIFEINVGKSRIRHRTTLNLNIQSILTRSRNSSFRFRVVLWRIRLFPTLILKIKWFGSELPLNTNLSIRSIWTRRSELNSLRLTIIWNWCGLVNHLSLASLWNLFLVSRFVNLFSWYNINQKIKLNNDSSVILVTPTGEIPWELH